MNKKLTKLLSVFIIAGAIGTGSALGLAGCGHKHSAASEWQSDETNHWHNCTANDGEQLDLGAHEYDNDSDATCNVCGYERQVTIAVTGVSLDKTAVTLKMGATVTATLVATVAPSNATNKNVTWSSSDTAVATVANGVVTALKDGTATITVTTADGNHTATCAVTVEAADVTPATEYTVTFNMNGHGEDI
ncbi:MAG: Ig domain-containing protein, partial [Candidatus Coproplasma sp.]